MGQQMFNPVDFGSFEWTGDWYRWDAVRGHLEAKRARDEAARRLRRAGHKVRSFGCSRATATGFPGNRVVFYPQGPSVPLRTQSAP